MRSRSCSLTDRDQTTAHIFARAFNELQFPLAVPTDTAVDVVIPYDRGDLVAGAHAAGRVQQTEHSSTGTRIKARVPVALAASLREFSTT